MRDAVVEHHIAKGEKGELVARLILILAFYKALNLPDTSASLPRNPERPCEKFPESLVPQRPSDKILGNASSPGGHRGADSRNCFQKAKSLFHPFRPVQHETPEAKHLWAAVVRGQAIQCSYQQEEVDIIIPIVLAPEGPVLGETYVCHLDSSQEPDQALQRGVP
jgi:hypothetical protein